MRRAIVLTVLCLAWCGQAMAEPINLERYADCIHRIENGAWPPNPGRGEAYGIHSVHYGSEAEARAICKRTVQNKHAQWVRKGSHGDWIDYLASKYCPVNKALWARNLRFYLAKK